MVKVGDMAYLKVTVSRIKLIECGDVYVTVEYPDYYFHGENERFTLKNLNNIKKVRVNSDNKKVIKRDKISIGDVLLVPVKIIELENTFDNSDLYVTFEMDSRNLLLEKINHGCTKGSTGILVTIKKSA